MALDREGRSPVNGLSDPRPVSIQLPAGGLPVETAWRGAGRAWESAEPRPDGGLAGYWHAFRRRWLAAILLGIAVAGAAAPAVWLTYRPQFTATAAFRIAAMRDPIIPGNGVSPSTNYDLYKNTQQQYVKSRFVLLAAVRNPAVIDLPMVRSEPDPAGWLARNLRVEFPGGSELMQISLKTYDRVEAAALVNAVKEAYKNEIVDVESRQRRKRMDEIDKIRSEKEGELRAKQNELKGLVKQVGSGERDALTLQQQIALQQYAALRSELSTTKFKLMRLKWDFASKKALAERSGAIEVTESELAARLEADPAAALLLREIADLHRRREATASVFSAGGGAEYARKFEERQKSIDKQIAARKDKLREELKVKKLLDLQSGLQQIDAEIAAAEAQEKQLTAEAQKAESEAKSVGSSSIDVEMIRTEIAQIQNVLRTASDERERLFIESRSDARISEFFSADVPMVADSNKQLQYATLAGLAGFFGPFLAVLWLDVRARRVSSSSQVFASTGLEVIGGVPLVPGRAVERVFVGTGRQQRFQQRMHESVDGIAARLLHLAARDQTRVVLVSSAVSGEGKTTLATQLSLSLARMAHRVLLLDFDLRRPAIDQVFDLPLEPGLAGILRKEADLSEAIQETDIESLSILPAGRGDRRLLASLANGALGTLFGKLREAYDFVIVDGSPILPVPDTRFLCRHVDGVVFSVLRDVSSVPDIMAACDVLAGFGIRPLGAVVTGDYHDRHYQSPAYVSGD